jgi:cellobiose phosphorylase
MPRRRTAAGDGSWWRFAAPQPGQPADGSFDAWASPYPWRLYFPLANEGGALSWTSPQLHGGPAAGHHEYLAFPLTAEDIPHTGRHRGFWVTRPGRPPLSLAGDPARLEAGPGWFTRIRADGPLTMRATLWCPSDLGDPVECFEVVLTNTSRRTLSLIPYAAIPVFARSADNVRDHRHVTALLHRVARTRHGMTVQPVMSFDERGHRLNDIRYAVLASGPGGKAPQGIWEWERDFIGEGGTYAAPAAVWARRTGPARTVPRGEEALGGFRFAPCTLRPGRHTRYLIISGIARRRRQIEAWSRRMRAHGWAERSLSATRVFWRRRATQIAFRTSDHRLNHWLAWVGVQPTLRRLYGNSFLPQFDYGRGGRGWRDLWQDCLALLLTDPGPTRGMLLHHAGGIRIDGSNATIIGRQGEFIGDRNNIPRTWMDHGAWPVFTALLYVDQTGDAELLLARRPYFRDAQTFRCRRRDPSWSEREGSLLRTASGRVYEGTVLEHLLVQNLTAFFNAGGHNVCRLEGADWNDGLDMAPERGESTAFSAFYAWNLDRLASVIERLSLLGHARIVVARELMILLDRMPGAETVDYRSPAAKQRRLQRYLERVARRVSGRTVEVDASLAAADLRAKARDLSERIRSQEWVRAGSLGFFNGYYDNDGRRVEGRHPGGVLPGGRLRVRMTLTGQVFPVMSGSATDAQVTQVIRAVDRWLRDPKLEGVRLNTDFGGPQMSLGRAFSFVYGEKENGAVFSHMAVMYAAALYARRRAREARRVWHALYRLATNQPVAKIFPCLPEYFNLEGRGMYGYLTGSASWLIYVLLTQAYGIRGDWGDLVLDPQLTLEDFGAGHAVSIAAPFAGRRVDVTLINAARREAGQYAVSAVLAGAVKLPAIPRAEGGVRISRRVLASLPPGRAALRVMLTPAR